MKELTYQEEETIASIVCSLAIFEKGELYSKNLRRTAREVEKLLSNLYDIEVRIDILELLDGRINVFVEGK